MVDYPYTTMARLDPQQGKLRDLWWKNLHRMEHIPTTPSPCCGDEQTNQPLVVLSRSHRSDAIRQQPCRSPDSSPSATDNDCWTGPVSDFSRVDGGKVPPIVA